MQPIIKNSTTIYNLLLSAKQTPEANHEFYEAGDHVKIYNFGIYQGDCDKEAFFTEYHKLFPSIKGCGFFDKSTFKSFILINKN
jgi:hypothetical protein